MTNTLEFTPVQSSQISGVANQGETLSVQFTSGQIYNYFNVPNTMFEDMLAADSAGKFFNANIRNKFTFEKVEVTQGS